MQKHIVFILAIVMLFSITGCSSQEQQPSSVNTTPSTKTVTPENSGDRATDSFNKPLSNQFNSETNMTVLLETYQFELPNNWLYAEGNTNIMWFSPDQESPLSALFLLDSEEKYDISMQPYQETLAEAIVDIYCDVFTDVSCNIENYYVPRKYFTLAGGEKIDVTGRNELHIECSGLMGEQNYEGKIIAFYIGDELISFYLFQFCDSAYDFSEDMEAIVTTIKKADVTEEQPPKEDTEENEPDNTGSTANTSDIDVRFETDYIDGDRLHITVFTKNNSEETFSGNVYVTFYSADGKDRLGSDTIIVNELLPGRESWADIVVDSYRDTPKMTVDFSEVSFIPVKEVTAEVDSDATEKTKSSYYWNFDGVSWYNDITDIVVYTDGTCVVTVKKETKENGQFYAATIWSCGNDYGVEGVQVVDPDGKILAVY